MNRTGALRGLLGALAAITLATSAPALASGAAATSQTRQLSPVATRTAATCSPGAHPCPIRIVFASGAYSGQAHSQLTGIRSQRWFVIRAHAGQTMIIVVKGHGPTRGTVYLPNGRHRGQPGGRVFDGPLPVTGDYRIRVTESAMGQAWSGRVDVIALIY
jgi:hypothetical protein